MGRICLPWKIYQGVFKLTVALAAVKKIKLAELQTVKTTELLCRPLYHKIDIATSSLGAFPNNLHFSTVCIMGFDLVWREFCRLKAVFITFVVLAWDLDIFQFVLFRFFRKTAGGLYLRSFLYFISIRYMFQIADIIHIFYLIAIESYDIFKL